MLRFLSQIRKQLLGDSPERADSARAGGKTGQYLKYALGEILLVMIGILLALQVNNWNEERKLQLKSLDYLKRLKVDLENVSEDVNRSVNATERKYHDALVALEALESKELLSSEVKDFESHLRRYFQFQITIQNTTAYNEMLSSGDLGLIKNEWLRTAFSDLSDSRDFIMEVNQSNHRAYKNNMDLIEKYVRYHIQNRDTDSEKIEVSYDFDAMANDDIFINQVSNQAYTWWDILRLYKRYNGRVNRIKDSIQKELKKYD